MSHFRTVLRKFLPQIVATFCFRAKPSCTWAHFRFTARLNKNIRPVSTHQSFFRDTWLVIEYFHPKSTPSQLACTWKPKVQKQTRSTHGEHVKLLARIGLWNFINILTSALEFSSRREQRSCCSWPFCGIVNLPDILDGQPHLGVWEWEERPWIRHGICLPWYELVLLFNWQFRKDTLGFHRTTARAQRIGSLCEGIN